MPHLTLVASDSEAQLKKERVLVSAFLVVVSFLLLVDIAEDLQEGAFFSHILWECVTFSLCMATAAYLWYRSNRRWDASQSRLREDLVEAKRDAVRWRDETRAILQGLGAAIDQQFCRWELSTAEKEVGILLLKGLSHKEIASIRETSERTVRQQAAAVYKKANLESRAQLSAFFLEDVLLPLHGSE